MAGVPLRLPGLEGLALEAAAAGSLAQGNLAARAAAYNEFLRGSLTTVAGRCQGGPHARAPCSQRAAAPAAFASVTTDALAVLFQIHAVVGLFWGAGMDVGRGLRCRRGGASSKKAAGSRPARWHRADGEAGRPTNSVPCAPPAHLVVLLALAAARGSRALALAGAASASAAAVVVSAPRRPPLAPRPLLGVVPVEQQVVDVARPHRLAGEGKAGEVEGVPMKRVK